VCLVSLSVSLWERERKRQKVKKRLEKNKRGRVRARESEGMLEIERARERESERVRERQSKSEVGRREGGRGSAHARNRVRGWRLRLEFYGRKKTYSCMTHVRDMTHYVCVIGLIHVCDMAHECACYDSACA